MYKSRDAKVRKQRETHSEIERKRRERMKRETEFLASQLLDNAVRKDKLSIYKAGAEQLLNYTEKLGRRDFILNDSEYSAILVENFNGISFQVVCNDGEILWCRKSKLVLGIDENDVIGNTLFNICEPSLSMLQLIEENLTIGSVEDVHLRSGAASDLLSRNFIVKMKVADKFPKTNCVRGLDAKWYRYIELCGDIFLNPEELNVDENGSHIVFKCLGYPLDIATPELTLQQHFLMKLMPENYQVIKIVGKLRKLLGISKSEILNKNLSDFIVDEEKQYFKNSFNECISKESLNFLIKFKCPDQTKRQFSVSLHAIAPNKKLLFVLGKFQKYSHKMETVDDPSWIKSENIKTESDQSMNMDIQESEGPVTFGLDETILTDSVSPKYTADEIQAELSDCEYLPSNDSFKSLLGDCNDLFYSENIQDLVLEDINDIKCDESI